MMVVQGIEAKLMHMINYRGWCMIIEKEFVKELKSNSL
jgi:hypothetical protein